jgi:urease accessory protein
MNAPVSLERARGSVSLRVGATGEGNAILGLGQAGCARLLFPAIARGSAREAVIVNTAGGLTGGDLFTVEADVEREAAAVLTTQACERIYRSLGGPATVRTHLSVAEGARLSWLPQETILFDRSGLARSLSVDIGAGATFLAVEAVLLGRKASGETLTTISFRDSWRIRREGQLVFADETALGEALGDALTARPALGGASAFATILLVAPDAEARLERLRELPTNDATEAGFSAFDGLCLARLIAQDGASLRSRLLPLLTALGGEPPLVWSL